MKQFEEIPDFRFWLFMAREYLTLDMIKTINPLIGIFYKYGNAYLHISIDSDTGILWVLQVAGSGNDWLSALAKTAIKNKMNKIVFVTNVNNKPVNAFAKYYKCDLVETIQGFYGESAGNQWSLDLSKPNYRIKYS